MTKGVNTRALVLDMLLEITGGRGYSHVVIRQVLDKYNYLEPQEKAFIKRVTEGTLERMIELDYILDQFSKTPVKKMKSVIRCILRMGVYQLLYMDGIPDSAVCNEAVRLAEKRKFFQLKGFVNGVLRNVAREKGNIAYPDFQKEPVKAMSVCYSMPEWMVEMWMSQYGAEQTKQLLAALLEEHPVTVRLRETLSETEKEQVLGEWQQHGFCAERHPYLSYAYTLKRGEEQKENAESISELPSFVQGKFYIQDVSSMFVAECAGIKPGDFVLDVCAAPGGKSLHAADKVGKNGQVEARDVSEDKVEKIRENIERLQLSNVTVRVQDAREQMADSGKRADVLLIDVPCSGLGVMGKKRDIKYKVNPESMPELQELQRQIIRTSLSYVKSGGTVMLSTCTIRKEENEALAEWMERELPVKLESLDGDLPDCLKSETTKKGYLQFLPGVHQTDGFFLAKFSREDV